MIFLENQLKICFYNKFIDVFLPLFTEGNNNKEVLKYAWLYILPWAPVSRNLRENEKFRETVFACSFGAQVKSFQQKNGKNLVTLSL